MSLSPAFLDELRARVPLAPVVARRVKLTRAGREWKGCCPFHNEKTPSFYVNDDKGFYHCFGCGVHGDVIRFVTEQEGLGFVDAVKMLAEQAGMEMPTESPEGRAKADAAQGLQGLAARAAEWFAAQLKGDTGTAARAYLERRDVSATLVRDFALGFAPDSRTGLKTALADAGEAKLVEAGLLGRSDEGETYDRFRGRLIFPIRDARGRAVGFGGRALGDVQPKYLNSADGPLFDKGRLLYNLDRAAPAARKSGRLIVVEGYMDVIGLARAGIVEAVAPLGTALTEAQIELAWRQVAEPILCFDGDAAGQRAALRACMRALPLLQPGKSLRVATLPPGEDPDDLVKRGGGAAFELVLATAEPLIERLWRAETEYVDTTTPERRAAVRQRLKEHAAEISDASIRSLYLKEFEDRFEALFLRKSKDLGYTFVKGHYRRLPAANQPQPASAELLSRRGQVSADAFQIRGILTGLLHYPILADRYGEPIYALQIGSRPEKMLRDAVLTIVAEEPGLESKKLLHHLDSLELGHFARQLFSATRYQRHQISFAAPGIAIAIVDRDMAALLTALNNRAAIEQELEVATAQLGRSTTEDGYLAQQALRKERDEVIAAMMRLAESLRED